MCVRETFMKSATGIGESSAPSACSVCVVVCVSVRACVCVCVVVCACMCLPYSTHTHPGATSSGWPARCARSSTASRGRWARPASRCRGSTCSSGRRARLCGEWERLCGGEWRGSVVSGRGGGGEWARLCGELAGAVWRVVRQCGDSVLLGLRECCRLRVANLGRARLCGA